MPRLKAARGRGREDRPEEEGGEEKAARRGPHGVWRKNLEKNMDVNSSFDRLRKRCTDAPRALRFSSSTSTTRVASSMWCVIGQKIMHRNASTVCILASR